MSYILEALKKSEQERHIGQVPDISVVQATTSAHASRWPWYVLAALLVNALVIAVVAWRPWDDRTVATAQSQSNSLSPSAESQDRNADVPQSEPVLPARSEASDAHIPERAAPIAPAPVMVERAPPMPVVERASMPDEVVRWQDLPADERDRLPVPRIDVHVFASDPARRFVLVNLRKYQEGETLDQGVKLDAIRADGIVLSYQGQRYRVDRP